MSDINRNSLRVATYNLHGYNQGSSLLKDLCNNNYDIIAVEEHWLSATDLHKIINFHCDFQGFAWSAMTDKLQKDIIIGRPFGGLGLLVNRSLQLVVTVNNIHALCRCASLMLTFPNGFQLLLIIVYFPCVNREKHGNDYEDEILECLGFIEDSVEHNTADGILVVGDMNFEWRAANAGRGLFESLAEELRLKCCDDLCQNDIVYTYKQNRTGSMSLIDHIFVDWRLEHNVVKYDVVEEFVNFSDHLPVACQIDLDFNVIRASNQKANIKPKANYSRRWDKGDLSTYYSNTYEKLRNIRIPMHCTNADCDAFMCCHWQDINCYYNSLIFALQASADDCIPLLKQGALKSFWSEELNDLKKASIEAHQLWLASGKPNKGLINDIRKNSKYKYKLAIRSAARTADIEFDDEISQLYLKKDITKFWKKFNSRFSKRDSEPTSISGLSDDADIAEVFSKSFYDVYFDSYSDGKLFNECLIKIHDNILSEENNYNIFDIADIQYALEQLKIGKACGFDGISKEHIMYCHPSIFVHLSVLFNMIYYHGFVPDDFGKGITIPLVKDKLGDVSSVDNYRAITISPLVSKLFEYCVLKKFDVFLSSSDLQFGFKQNSSCTQAVFLLRQVVEYFLEHGSNIYIASLDACKAFDRVNHVKLFNVLLDRGVPGRLVKVIVDWYGKSTSVVRWNGSFSTAAHIKSGIRQGGILSPVFFNMYIDVMFHALHRSDLGCHLGSMYVGYIAYADDIILISASVCDLQSMIDICFHEGNNLDILFNASKSCLFKIGKVYKENLISLNLGTQSLQWAEKIKYLGLHFVSHKSFKVDFAIVIRKCYTAANNVFKHSKYVTEIAKLCLAESFILPILTYAIEALNLSKLQCHKLNVCWNNIYRKIFGMHKWESVKLIQFFCDRLDFNSIYNLRKLKFTAKVAQLNNIALSKCSINEEFNVLCLNYKLCSDVSVSRLEAAVRNKFKDTCMLKLAT